MDHDDYLVFAPALGRQESCLHIALETAQEPLGVDLWSEHGPARYTARDARLARPSQETIATGHTSTATARMTSQAARPP